MTVSVEVARDVTAIGAPIGINSGGAIECADNPPHSPRQGKRRRTVGVLMEDDADSHAPPSTPLNTDGTAR